jgi:hypothetical protein
MYVCMYVYMYMKIMCLRYPSMDSCWRCVRIHACMYTRILYIYVYDTHTHTLHTAHTGGPERRGGGRLALHTHTHTQQKHSHTHTHTHTHKHNRSTPTHHTHYTPQEDLSDEEGADSLFTRVLTIDPNNVDSLVTKARLTLRLKRDASSACTLFQRAFALDTDGATLDPGMLCMYAGLLEDVGDTTQAQHVYERAVQWDPTHIPALFNYALLLENSASSEGVGGDTSSSSSSVRRAVDMYKCVLAIDPAHFETLSNYAGLLDAALRCVYAAALVFCLCAFLLVFVPCVMYALYA